MRIMGIDYGDSRIGIAVSDLMGWTAQAVETISAKNGMKAVLNRIKELAGQLKAEKLVVGFPKNMDGTVGFRGEKTEEFIGKLREVLDLDIVKWDERLSTVSAHRTMQELGIKTSKKKGVVDQLAAVYILQGYLDSLR